MLLSNDMEQVVLKAIWPTYIEFTITEEVTSCLGEKVEISMLYTDKDLYIIAN